MGPLDRGGLMAEGVDHIILEQLRLIRDDLSEVKTRLGNVETSQKSLKGMMFGLAGYIRGIDERVEHIEAKLGIET